MADLAFLHVFPSDKPTSASQYDRQAQEYVKTVDKLTDAFWRDEKKANVVDQLDPAVQSIAYLYALHAHAHASGLKNVEKEELLSRAIIFFTSYDGKQIRYVGEKWRQLMEWAIQALPDAGVTDFSPLTSSMLRLDPHAGVFTTTHLRIVRLCLDNGVPSQALPILDKNIFAFPQAPPKSGTDGLPCDDHEFANSYITTKSGVSPSLKPDHVLEYYLLGAHIYIGLRNWERARLFLEILLLHPAQYHAVHAVQIEGYKKWVLVGLLAEGKSFPLPRTHDAAAMKTIRAVSKAYEALATDFENRDLQKFQAEADKGMQLWQDDGNLPLVREANDALLRYRVIDLRHTYAALRVEKVATHLELAPDATLQLLNSMTQQGHLHASLTPAADSNPSSAILRFDLAASPPGAQDVDLEAQTVRIHELTSFVRDADRRLQLIKEYVEHSKRAKNGFGTDADLADQMDLTWDGPMESGGVVHEEDGDEDIMAG